MINDCRYSCNYRPHAKFAKVMFFQVSVCPRGDVCGGGGYAWQGVCVARGVCMAGGMCGKGCMHGRGVCAWQGACGGHACHAHPQQILQDMVHERVVRILLECILVYITIYGSLQWSSIFTNQKVKFGAR